MAKSNLTQKKLKAIVFTDMADFTKISAQDEQKALDLIQKQNDIIKPIVEKHNGEWLKEIGDGLLFSFDSSLEAVRCSIEIQETLKEIEDLNIRIGIHQGDIFIKDGDIFGDDVNIASRVEGFAPVGGISLSDKVHKDILGVSDIKTSFIGHRKLIGVQQETKIRCITSHNLPQYNLNKLPIIASYVCFFWAALSFVACIGFPIAASIIGAKLPIIWMSIVTFMVGITHLLIGYSTLSFSRGISSKSQRFLVYLSYIFVILPFILLIFNPSQQATFSKIVDYGFPMIAVFLLILIVIPSVITIFFKRIFSKKN
jgi:hypothetical protein